MLHGRHLIAGHSLPEGPRTLYAHDASNGEHLEPGFHDAGSSTVAQAAEAAAQAQAAYQALEPELRALFLEAVAEEIEALGDTLIERAMQETGLPEARLLGERTRTVNQLRLFARLARDGSWLDARIDLPDPGRTPLPKPDVRSMRVALGPVAVFGAANFPLAISVAGSDTASALAVGCCVVVKAHPAHPGTSELVGACFQSAAQGCGIPAGAFNLVHASRPEVCLDLVRHPAITAVAFTGSQQAGRALFDAAAARGAPIPVYAELGSVNPQCFLPGALRERGEALAAGYVGSLALGVGQFCTNPGIACLIADQGTPDFLQAIADVAAKQPAAPMLHAGIHRNYDQGLAELRAIPGVDTLHLSSDESAGVAASVLVCDAATFRRQPRLSAEVFGPVSLLVRCKDQDELLDLLGSFEGQLSASIHRGPGDEAALAAVHSVLAQRVGRLVIDGFPTGIEVCPAMHHGGPWPATTNAAFTSIGTRSLERFLRPLCYQDTPQELLPPELRDHNQRGLLRLVDGEMTREDCAVGLGS